MTMCAPTARALASAALRLARIRDSKLGAVRRPSSRGGTLISMLNWPSSVTKSGSAIASSTSRVAHRRVRPSRVDQVELDLQAGHAARSRRTVASDSIRPATIEIGPDLVPVSSAVRSAERLQLYVPAHADPAR